MSGSMKTKLWKVIGGFVLLLLLFMALLSGYARSINDTEQNGSAVVLLNEIRQLGRDAEGYNPAGEQIDELQEYFRERSDEGEVLFVKRMLLVFLVFGIGYLAVIFGYVYWRILKPFAKLEKYAEQIADGDLDVSLGYERENYFGAFTWAFDHMREEIRYARKREREAIEENKTVIAALSHDIKTPIASIRACSEVLEANLNADYEKRQRYTSIILKKCDEVTALVNDLVLHSLSELEKLEIHLEKLKIADVIRETVEEMAFSDLLLEEPLPDAAVTGDAARVAQIIENLLNNARKYAPGAKVHIYAKVLRGQYWIHVQDEGDGILPQDMPFVLQKFYRGRNVEGQPGSGLGLYIVRYLAEAMKGEVRLENTGKGLDVAFCLPVDCS